MEARPSLKHPYSSLSSPSLPQQHPHHPPSQSHGQQQQPPLHQGPPLQAGLGRPASFSPVPMNSFGAATSPLTGQKRDAMGVPLAQAGPGPAVTQPQESLDGGNFAKLFVGSVPKTITEEQVRPMFAEHGNVLEVAILREKRTGQQQGALEHKLFVGCVNRQAIEKEIEEIFAPYGQVDDVYIMRDEAKQSRGCAFVKYPTREMAMAAINALNGLYVMRGCDQPLTVRFAEPKKVRTGDTRVGGPGFGPGNYSPRPGYAPAAGLRADHRVGSYGGGQGHPLGWHQMQGIRPGVQGASSPHDMHGTAHVPVGTPSPVGGIIGNASIATNGLPQGLNTLGSLNNAASQGMVAGGSQQQSYFGASVRQSPTIGQHSQAYSYPPVTYSQQGSSQSQQAPTQQHTHQQLVGGASILPPQQTSYSVGPSMHQYPTVYGQQSAISSMHAQQPQSHVLPSVQQPLPGSGVQAVQPTQPVAMLSAQQQAVPVPIQPQPQSLLQTSHPRPMVQPMQQQQSQGFQSSHLPAVHATSQLYGPQTNHPQLAGQNMQGNPLHGQPSQLQQLQSQPPLQAQQHQIQPLQAQQHQIQPLQAQQHQMQPLQAHVAQSQPSQTQQHQGQLLQAQQHHVHQQSPQQQQLQQQDLQTQQLQSQQQPVYHQQMPSVQQALQQASWTAPVQQPQAVSSGVSPGPAVGCPWTEHTSPEGYKYYYNSTTGESKWEKPQELVVAEKQLQPQAQPQPQSQQQQQQQHSSGANFQQYGGAGPGAQFPTQGLSYAQSQPVAGSLDQVNKQQVTTAQHDWAWKGRPAGT